jgi:hypothetical protein
MRLSKPALMACLLLLSTLSWADEMPLQMTMNQFGYRNCVVENTFNPKFDCGQPYFVTLECDKAVNPEASKIQVLAVGSIRSDVTSECSPVHTIQNVIEANSR